MNNLNQLPVDSLPGIGKQKKEVLTQLGIYSIADLLEYYPFRYDDFAQTDLSVCKDEDRVTVYGKICGEPSIRWYGKKKSRLTVKCMVDKIILELVWFNQPYLKTKLEKNSSILVIGKMNTNRLQITVERTLFTESQINNAINRLVPIYSTVKSLKSDWLRNCIYEAFLRFGKEITEILPKSLLVKYGLMSRARSMYYTHFPKSLKEGQEARRRLVYEELFLYEMKLLWAKKQHEASQNGKIHNYNEEKIKLFLSQLPFQLTASQQAALNEILEDMKSNRQMNRLLQGDVGCGKTVVAAVSLYANYLSGYQGALMVPTEILAEQHATSLRQLLSPFGLNFSTLTGSMSKGMKEEQLQLIKSGKVDIIIGTHALIQETVHFENLGLAITDEQHRFGVRQRAVFKEKGKSVDILYMTATPIPRTLAITVFGEMDVSTIKEMPVGRKPVMTYWIKKNVWPRVISFIKKEAEKDNQIYVVCPLIEESEKLDLQNAEQLFVELSEKLQPIQVGLLHGRMGAKEKEKIMLSFTSHQLEVLVSTTVIEVGVNVPTATAMVVYDADRFGLAQLHQLRGRVGRGGGTATCVLVADPKTELGVERMRIMTETTDGFEISKRDLELRGPGDFLGVRQSGLPDFKVADLSRDAAILEKAREDAIYLLAKEDFLRDAEGKTLLSVICQEKLQIRS